MLICGLSKTRNPRFFLFNLLNLCEPQGAKVREASVRFNIRRENPVWDLCEPLTQIQQDSTKKIICANLWLKKHQFNPLKPNLHLFKNIKIGVNGFQIGLNRCLFQHLPYPAAAFR